MAKLGNIARGKIKEVKISFELLLLISILAGFIGAMSGMGGGVVLIPAFLIAVGVVWHWISTRQLGLDYTITGMNLFQFLINDVSQVTHGAFRPRLFVNRVLPC